MKVLILHQHFNTPQKGGAIRSYYLAKALADRGIQVVVITAHNKNQYETETIEGIQVHYLPIEYENRFGFYKRSFAFLQYVLKSVRLVRKLSGVDICYAISVPLTIGLAAMWIKKRYQIPYYFEVGDLWPEAPIQMGFVENPLLRRILLSLERMIYQQADSIVALSPMIKSAVEKKIQGKTVHLIPNMADTDYFKPERKQPDIEREFGVEGQFVVSYIGAVGLANGLDYFLDCARASQKAALPIRFLLCGEGAMLDGLKQSSQRLMLLNLSFINFQNREGVRKIMNISDAVFVSYKNVPILETGSPNKYFDGLAAGKLILINFGGWIKEEIEKEECGVYVDPRHPTDFVKKIAPFLHQPDHLLAFQRASRKLAEERYSRVKLGAKFSSLFRMSLS